MIILSSSLVLSPGGQDLNAPVIGWQNLVRFGGVTADSQDTDFPASHLANAATTYRWQSASTATQYVTVDTSPDDPVDYMGLARHNLGSAQVTVSVEAYISGSWTEVFAPFIPGTDSPILMRFTEVPTAELFRLKLVPDGVAPTIAVMYLGKLLVLERRIYVGHTPLPYGRGTEFTNAVSENGDFQGRITLRERLETSVSLSNLTPAWYRNKLDPFFSGGKDQAFFFGWRPLTYPDGVGYAWLTNNPKPSNQRSNGMMQVAMQMGGLVL